MVNISQKIILALVCLTALVHGEEIDRDTETNGIRTDDNVALTDLPPPLPQPEAWQNRLVDMLVNTFNGYMSHKIIWQKVPQYGDSYALHAALDIKKGETLFVVPTETMIGSNGTSNACFTVLNMMQVLEEGESNKHYPYLDYLTGNYEGGTRAGLMPTTWSDAAKDILEDIVGTDLAPQPTQWEKKDFWEVCDDYVDDEDTGGPNWAEKEQLYDDLYLFFYSRSFKDKMVPFLDQINHRNGKWRNAEGTSAHIGQPVTIYATRDIAKGEEIFYTYNECLEFDCNFGRIKYTYITPDLLSDFGFVEGLPHRFAFKGIPGAVNFVEVDEDPETEGELTFKWLFYRPTEERIKWVEKELARLKEMEEDMMECTEELSSSHEKYNLQEYYRVLVETFELALIHKDDEAVQPKTGTDLKHPEDDHWDIRYSTQRQLQRYYKEYSAKYADVLNWYP